jgi:hypothetical protein
MLATRPAGIKEPDLMARGPMPAANCSDLCMYAYVRDVYARMLCVCVCVCVRICHARV